MRLRFTLGIGGDEDVDERGAVGLGEGGTYGRADLGDAADQVAVAAESLAHEVVARFGRQRQNGHAKKTPYTRIDDA